MTEALTCRYCGDRIPDHPTHRRLQVCAMHACFGMLADCEVCGESWPEHGPGGRGCATWVYPPEWAEGTPFIAGGE